MEMAKSSTQSSGNLAAKSPAEVRLRGNPVSHGVATGAVQTLHGVDRQFFKRNVGASATGTEVARFQRSLFVSRQQLEALMQDAAKHGPLEEILSTQQLLLDDPQLCGQIEKTIGDEQVNAEWATMTVVATMSAKLRSLGDDGLRERYADVEDIGDRILSALSGSGASFEEMPKGAIIAASELRPSTLAALAGSQIKGIVTEHGGWTSHTFILAREMGIPAVTGVRELLRRTRNGETVLVDGDIGEVIINPSHLSLDNASAQNKRSALAAAFRTMHADPVRAVDGRAITIKANIDFPSYYARAKEQGVEGIGLYRSEFLLDQFTGLPGEDDQYQAYKEIADLAGNAGANIRTFDVGIRRLPEDIPYRERNAALGLRAIRLSLTREKDFRIQLRALLRAAAGRNLSVTLPMISGVGEIRQARTILDEERGKLNREGIKAGTPALGAMVEVPSTIFIIDELVEETDFICLGTNDLVQYMLAVDRDNELVASWFNTLHPSVIRAVRKVVDHCARAGKPLTVCGEMAGSPYYAPVLIGLGATELSMNVNAIARIREVISAISYSNAQTLASAVESAATSEEAESILMDHIHNNWPDLYPPRERS